MQQNQDNSLDSQMASLTLKDQPNKQNITLDDVHRAFCEKFETNASNEGKPSTLGSDLSSSREPDASNEGKPLMLGDVCLDLPSNREPDASNEGNSITLGGDAENLPLTPGRKPGRPRREITLGEDELVKAHHLRLPSTQRNYRAKNNIVGRDQHASHRIPLTAVAASMNELNNRNYNEMRDLANHESNYMTLSAKDNQGRIKTEKRMAQDIRTKTKSDRKDPISQQIRQDSDGLEPFWSENENDVFGLASKGHRYFDKGETVDQEGKQENIQVSKQEEGNLGDLLKGKLNDNQEGKQEGKLEDE